MRNRGWNSLLAAAAVMALAACGGDAGEQTDTPATDAQAPAEAGPVGANVELPEGVTLDMVQQGKTVFETTTCWTCHGMDAAGGPLAPALTDEQWLNNDGSYEGIAQIVRNGVPEPKEHQTPMPAMGGAPLTEDQINQVAAYVYAISRGG